MSEKILVIGGTRGTGKAVVEQLIYQERSCTVLARNVLKAKALFGNTAEIVYGDVTRPETLHSTMFGNFNAIIYTVDITGGIGDRGFFANRQVMNQVIYKGVVNTVDAAKANSFQHHFILLTTLGLYQPSLIMTALNWLKPDVVQASRNKASYLVQSGLLHTIVQAGALHDQPTSTIPLVITQGEIPMRIAYRISRQNLAQVLIAAIGHPQTHNRVFNVYGGNQKDLSYNSIDEQFKRLL